MGQQRQRVIQGQQFDSARGTANRFFVQRNAQDTPSSLGVPAAARVIHQNAPDDLRAQAEKLHAALTLDAPRADEFEISLIGQGGRFESVRSGLTAEVLSGDSAE